MLPHITVSCGDVNGIGLRCFAQALLQATFNAHLRLAIAPVTLSDCIDVYGLPGTFNAGVWELGAHCVDIDALTLAAPVTPGVANDDASRLAIESLDVAIAAARDGKADAIVTLPINKHALTRVGWPHAGQTEMLAAAVGGTPLMVLCAGDVRVALVTVHIPLRDVVSTLSTLIINQRIAQLAAHLRDDLGIAKPRIAVLAVNPHAGDHGVIGNEDDTIVAPAVVRARESGIDAHGPLPADGFFAFGDAKNYDGILAMYHDQGLIPVKLLARGGGCNVTAGLSVVRTAPDHGTAYALADGGTVDPSSTVEAILMALRIADYRRR